MRGYIALSVLAILLAGPGRADIFVVEDDGTGDFPTIQEALSAAQDGDVVELADGEFFGDGNRDLDCLGKAITVRSQSGNPGSCIIDCEGTYANPHRGFVFQHGEGPGTVLEAITIQGGCEGIPEIPYNAGGGIYCGNQSGPTIRHCILRHNIAVIGGGMCCDDASPLVENCLFLENEAESGAGLAACFSSFPEIHACTFVRNDHYGVFG